MTAKSAVSIEESTEAESTPACATEIWAAWAVVIAVNCALVRDLNAEVFSTAKSAASKAAILLVVRAKTCAAVNAAAWLVVKAKS